MTTSSVHTVPVEGEAHADFAAIEELAARAVAAQGGGGLAVAVYRDGRRVADITAGDQARDGIQLMFSVSKAMAAAAIVVAVERGLLDLDAPLAQAWPEFQHPSRRDITLRHVLSHRAGLPVFEAPISLTQLLTGTEEESLATQTPRWEPGTEHGYHAFTFGTLVRGAFLRTTGRGIGDFFAEEVARPLGLNAWLGLPTSELHRVVPLRFGDTWTSATLEERVRSATFADSTWDAIGEIRETFNDPQWLSIENPAATGVASARSIARMMSALISPVDGIRLGSDDVLDDMIATQSVGLDRVLQIPTRFGSGFQLPFPQFPMLTTRSFGHEAAGGSVAIADPALGVSLAITTNMFPPMQGSSSPINALVSSVRVMAEDAAR